MSSLAIWQSITNTSSNSQLATLAESVLKHQPTETQHLTLIGADNSGSTFTSGAINVLRAALPKFIADLCADYATRSSLLVTFSKFEDPNTWRVTAPFSPVGELVPPHFSSTSSTPFCTRVIEEIELIKAQRKLVRACLQVDQRRSWLIETTDGYASDPGRSEEARNAIQNVAVEAGIEVYLFGMGEGANMSFLQSLAQPERPAELLSSDRDFAKLFKWISNSLHITSRSIAGEVAEIPSISGRLIPTE